MKLATAYQMRMIDEKTQNEWSIPADLLMERAALSVAQFLKTKLSGVYGKKIYLFCGKGHNGGDGLALARILKQDQAEAVVVLVSEPSLYQGLAKLNLDRADRYHVPIVQWEDFNLWELASADLIVDGLLGTGAQGPPYGIYPSVIGEINRAGRTVVALDIPSGVDVDSGRIWNEAVKANYTVTFGLAKPGLLIYPGAEFAGEVIVSSIGFPNELLESGELTAHSLTVANIAAMLPERTVTAHKGSTGHSLVIAGSTGMTGAATLAAIGALRSGCGRVTLGIRDDLWVVEKPMEVITLTWNQLKDLSNYESIVIGPGLTTAEDGKALLHELLQNATVPLVIDADGLNLLASDINLLKANCKPIILTPHPGEMARLTGLTVAAIQENRHQIAVKYAKEWNAVVVLKGARSIIALPDGRSFINLTGNSGMATAGMGDVLAGIISGLVAQGLPINEAAIVGTFLHGLAGDCVAEKNGSIGMLAGDLLAEIPKAIRKIQMNNDTI